MATLDPTDPDYIVKWFDAEIERQKAIIAKEKLTWWLSPADKKASDLYLYNK